MHLVEAHRPDLGMAVQAVAGGLTAGEGVDMIHQAALQQFLWWHVPRDYPDDEWQGLVEATAALLDELGLKRLAELARSKETEKVLVAWGHGSDKGVAAFRAAHAKSGVEPPDTALLAWGSIMGVNEARAVDAVERALGDAVAAGDLVPGAQPWQAKAAAIAEAVLSRPLDLPPGQTLAGLVTTERIGTWIDAARHPVYQEWRSAVANRLLHPVGPPPTPGDAVAPMRWLLERAAGRGRHRVDPEQLPRPGDGGGGGRTVRLVGLGEAATLGGRRPSAVDVARRGEPAAAVAATRSAAPPHGPWSRVARRSRGTVGTGLYRDRGRRGVHPHGHRGRRADTAPRAGRRRRAGREGCAGTRRSGLVDQHRPAHCQPRLVGGVAAAAMVEDSARSTRKSRGGSMGQAEGSRPTRSR